MQAFSRADKFILISALMLTQTIGWGTTFSQIGILAQPIGEELGLSKGTLFSGATLMYLGASLTAPMVGRLADRIGGLRLLVPGALIFSAGMVGLSFATGPHGYVGAWLLFGLALHLALGTAAFTGLTQTMGAEAARAIATVSLATGLCSSIFWPISEFALRFTDWRSLLWIYAAVTLLVCVPVHLWLSWRYGHLRAGQNDSVKEAPAHILPGTERIGFVVQTTVMSFGTFIGVGFGLAVIEIFQALGTPRAEAVYAGALIGVTFLIGRGLITVAGDRLTPLVLAQLTFVALPLSLSPLLIYGFVGQPLPGWVAAMVALAFGIPAGLVGILRSTLPLHLFGSAGYGQIFGKQARATEISSAISPAAVSYLLTLSPIFAVGALVAAGGAALLGATQMSRLVQPRKINA